MRLRFSTLALMLGLFGAVFSTYARLPLEGEWKAEGDGADLVLRADESFTWGDRSGTWMLDGAKLYLHSPGKLVGYDVKVRGRDLTLSGGDLYGGTLGFRYASGGSPVVPADLRPTSPPAQEKAASRPTVTVSQSEVPDTSLAELAYLARRSPLFGVWKAQGRISHFDRLQFQAGGQLTIDGNEGAGFRTRGDRIYVTRNDDTTEEWYFLQEGDYLAVAYSSLHQPRLYERQEAKPKQFRPRSFTPLAGSYLCERPTSVEGADLMSRTLIVEEGGHLRGWALDKRGVQVNNWSGLASLVSRGWEVRYEDGRLEIIPVIAEDHPIYGMLLYFDGDVYQQQANRPGSISKQEWLDPYDAARLREELNEMMQEVLPPPDLQPDTTIMQY